MFQKNNPESWLIVGLGNPGKEYERSRHNCGFRALDCLDQNLGVKVDKLKFQGLYNQTNYNGRKLFLLKPQTYMNLSGRSVLQLSAFFKIPPQNIIVMFDDISLEPGRLRVRANGSAGGHNGIKSIISELGSQDFPRVKIGVGAKPNPEYDLADWVLSSFSAQDEKAMSVSLKNAAEAALAIIDRGVPRPPTGLTALTPSGGPQGGQPMRYGHWWSSLRHWACSVSFYGTENCHSVAFCRAESWHKHYE